MKKEYRVMAVFILLIAVIIIKQNDSRPVQAQETTIQGAIVNVQQDKNHKKAIKQYIKSVFGACKADATAYISKTNNIYNTKLITHNYIDNTHTYDSSFIGLFSINDTLPITKAYTVDQLLDYRINTQLAYQIYVNNNYSFDNGTCFNK